jgi:hypothetical protein
MTYTQSANPENIRFARRPSPKWTAEKKMQWRQEYYAAMGPNCPNGHPWATNAKFTYLSYRFCDACTREKAEKRRNDPMTYTGACVHGHAYTRENTMISCWNLKVCLACKGKPDARPRSLKPGEMEKILKRARRGDTVNEISGEGGPKHRGKGIISRVRLLGACLGDTPEAIELKGLLKQNGEAAVGNGRPLFRWSYESIALLSTEYKNGSDPQKIADLINVGFGRDFSASSIYSKAHKLGLIERRARVIVPKPAKLPRLTAALRFPIGSLLDRINAVVPRHLARDHRDDVIGEMALAVYEGRLEEADIERRFREFVNAGYRRDHDQYGPVSLDVPIFEGSEIRGIDRVTETIWQQA